MKKLVRIIPFVIGLTPFLAFAQTLETTVENIGNIVDAIVPVFMILAVAVFLWGIVRYITAGGSPEKEKSARGFIIYGLIGIFVLVAFWGIIKIVANTLGVDVTGGSLPQTTIPKIEVQ